MENNPLFSVLIANYNNGSYLMETIESIRKQTYTNWEIIIVDDCSTDNSIQLYETLNIDSKIKIHSNEENKGVGFTKRKLCELANGEIAGFVDADDAIVEDALQQMVDLHILHQNHSLIYSTFYICDENLNIIKISPAPRDLKNKKYLDTTIGGVSHFATFKTSSYHKSIGVDVSLIMAEDQDLYYKLEEVGELKFVNLPLYKYRINPKGVSRTDRSEVQAWGLIAKYEASKRRGINPIKHLTETIKSEKTIIEFYENSIDYKIGKTILNPLRWVLYKFLKLKK